ncbi:class Ib ribonucleoside-diphosphate reductase assembly flavoprotein NrdI [Paenibacillus lactis]|uniref:class Ib ribonucleoside-diphosphate reductase assembly flavoprotein NrdI n=1 Tax=Paenibacillus lactis TaxID=228574 RepID=UPI003D751691
MLIVYDSLTGNVQKFVNKINMKNIKLTDSLIIDEPFILITYTIGFGEVPVSVKRFLESGYHRNYLKGVAGSGNKNWGSRFCKAAHTISQEYGVPLIHTFELSGTENDIEKFLQEVKNIV